MSVTWNHGIGTEASEFLEISLDRSRIDRSRSEAARIGCRVPQATRNTQTGGPHVAITRSRAYVQFCSAVGSQACGTTARDRTLIFQRTSVPIGIAPLGPVKDRFGRTLESRSPRRLLSAPDPRDPVSSFVSSFERDAYRTSGRSVFTWNRATAPPRALPSRKQESTKKGSTAAG